MVRRIVAWLAGLLLRMAGWQRVRVERDNEAVQVTIWPGEEVYVSASTYRETRVTR